MISVARVSTRSGAAGMYTPSSTITAASSSIPDQRQSRLGPAVGGLVGDAKDHLPHVVNQAGEDDHHHDQKHRHCNVVAGSSTPPGSR